MHSLFFSHGMQLNEKLNWKEMNYFYSNVLEANADL